MELEKLDQMVLDYKESRKHYEALSKESKEAHKVYKQKEYELLQALEESGKSKYFLDGVGTVTKVDRLSVPTPKDMDSKKALFRYLIKEGGEELLYAYATVNSQALNKFYNDTKEEKGLDHEIPGLEAPIVNTQLRFKGA